MSEDEPNVLTITDDFMMDKLLLGKLYRKDKAHAYDNSVMSTLFNVSISNATGSKFSSMFLGQDEQSRSPLIQLKVDDDPVFKSSIKKAAKSPVQKSLKTPKIKVPESRYKTIEPRENQNISKQTSLSRK